MVWTIENVKRAYPCNPEFLLFLREQKGWTQEKLAHASGYSERLISKAESGKSISSETIDDLATTFSTAEKPIYPEDLISDPLSLAKEYIRAFYVHQKEMFQQVKHFLHPDIVYRMAGDPAILPFAGEWHGLEEVERTLEIFFSIFTAPENHDPDPWYTYICEGNEVMMRGETWLQPYGKKLEKPLPVTIYFQFKQGKLILFDDVYDTMRGYKFMKERSPDPDN